VISPCPLRPIFYDVVECGMKKGRFDPPLSLCI
jgi:hypothetical protein